MKSLKDSNMDPMKGSRFQRSVFRLFTREKTEMMIKEVFKDEIRGLGHRLSKSSQSKLVKFLSHEIPKIRKGNDSYQEFGLLFLKISVYERTQVQNGKLKYNEKNIYPREIRRRMIRIFRKMISMMIGNACIPDEVDNVFDIFFEHSKQVFLTETIHMGVNNAVHRLFTALFRGVVRLQSYYLRDFWELCMTSAPTCERAFFVFITYTLIEAKRLHWWQVGQGNFFEIGKTYFKTISAVSDVDLFFILTILTTTRQYHLIRQFVTPRQFTVLNIGSEQSWNSIRHVFYQCHRKIVLEETGKYVYEDLSKEILAYADYLYD